MASAFRLAQHYRAVLPGVFKLSGFEASGFTGAGMPILLQK
jgi:hypothetical protein